MLYTFGYKSALKTIAVLSHPHHQNSEKSLATLKMAYCNYLETLQPQVSYYSGLRPLLVTTPELENEMLAHYRVESSLNDRNQSEIIKSETHSDRMRKARHLSDFLETEGLDPEFLEIFNLAINYIFFGPANKARAGTTSNAIGTIWLRDPSEHSSVDLTELLVHELTHNLMFLDERLYTHYTSYPDLLKPSHYCQSAILKTKRPMDKVVHSIAVATELVRYRQSSAQKTASSTVHPSNEILIMNAQKSIHEIQSRPELFRLLSQRGLQLLGSFEEQLAMAQRTGFAA